MDNTFVSTIKEAQTEGIVLNIFGIAAQVYPDSGDVNAVFAAVGALLAVIGFIGSPIAFERHY